MEFKSLEEIASRIKGANRKRTVAVAAASDEHVIDALIQAKTEGTVEPILVGDEPVIRDLLQKNGADDTAYTIINEPDPAQAAYVAVQLIREKKADFLMKGKLNTSTMLKAVLNKQTGLPNSGLLSYICMLEIPKYHKLLSISDSAIILEPTFEQKIKIINNSVTTLRKMGYDKPKVAVLSPAENINPKLPYTAEAAELKRMNQDGEIPNCIVEGPISVDLSLNEEAVAIKGYESEVAADADLLIVPDIMTGNMAAKILRQFAGAESIGLVVGSDVPIVLTSRGATVRSKYLSLLVAASAVE